jgi:hypothetical protein
MLIILAIGFCLGAMVSENLELAIPSLESSSSPIKTTGIAKAPKKRKLPTFDEGGVVIFFHVAKTGGTSIRSIFGKKARIMPHVYLETVPNATAFLNSAALVDRVLTRNTTFEVGKKVLFLETHGLKAPAMPFMHSHLQRWRQMAAEHGTSFFAFTLIREPVSYAVSYFNFFNAFPCTLGFCPWRLYSPTEGNLVTTTEANNQCLLMSRDHWGIFFMKNRTPPSTEECNNVYDMLLQDMDWIGTTEALSQETIPLLTFMLSHNMTLANTILPSFNVMAATKNATVVLKRSSLLPTTEEYIRSLSYLDQEMYNKVQSEFPMEMWDLTEGSVLV